MVLGWGVDNIRRLVGALQRGKQALNLSPQQVAQILAQHGVEYTTCWQVVKLNSGDHHYLMSTLWVIYKDGNVLSQGSGSTKNEGTGWLSASGSCEGRSLLDNPGFLGISSYPDSLQLEDIFSDLDFLLVLGPT